ncbi:chondroitin sulfate glucuronyltransferase [Alligator sinensis]|uniref:Hexosyltransferase n=1 Tax=Alligator sinensis TaxID=38654 RepID=A0A1U7SG47_ALLSI|nr:chondroitin sulfate glucuronyltransferase [Alligator sinensis]
MALVAHGDERPVWLMYETVRYLHQHFGADYDWFFVMQDDTYVQAEQVKALVSHLSIDQDVYLGRAEEFIGGDERARYCHGGFGYLSSTTQGLGGSQWEEGPVGDGSACPSGGEGITEFFLQMQIRNLTSLTPAGEAGLTWPVGIPAPFVPKSRFEVISWDYFTEQHLFSCPDGTPKCELSGAGKADVDDVIESALEQLNSRYQPLLRFYKRQLLNGYRRFDPTRGMEYTLDLLLEAVTQKGHSHVLAKRVSLVRPLSKMEIIPMPYVTEATRVQLVLPLTVQDLDFVGNFLDTFAMNTLDTHDNALLTLLFIYHPYDAQRVSQLDVFAGVKAMVAELEKRYTEVKIPWISVKTEVPSQVKLMDIVSKKHPVDTLFFLASVWTEVSMEFLNRCRMNTISNWQVFFPVHFQEFNPALVYRGEQASSSSADVLRDGRFDRHAFAEACFYNSDYMAARTKLAADILDRDEVLESMEVFDVFLRYSGLHLFRAVEPGLVQKYALRSCNPRLSEELYHRCVLSNLEGLASRSHLAMALFEQEQANST